MRWVRCFPSLLFPFFIFCSVFHCFCSLFLLFVVCDGVDEGDVFPLFFVFVVSASSLFFEFSFLLFSIYFSFRV